MGSMAGEAFIALGGNLGDVLGSCRRALLALQRGGVRVVDVSRAYRTTALMPEGEVEPAPDFWNAVCVVETILTPQALLTQLLAIESGEGRVRGRRWAPRTLDLDLLIYEDLVLKTPRLTLPHPGLAQRTFVLQPLRDVAAGRRLAAVGATPEELLAHHAAAWEGIREVRENWLSTQKVSWPR